MTDQQRFIDFLKGLAMEGETPLLVKQKPVGDGKQYHADGALKCTWPAYLPSRKPRAGEACYANTASFIIDRLDPNRISASAANCEYVLVMVLDDIGTKSKVPPLPPTWIIETSPQNYQYGYAFTENQPNKSDFAAAIRAIATAGYTDTGSTNPVRNFRIPGSINIKPGRDGFVSELTEFNPDKQYTLEEICSALEVTPDEPASTQVRYTKFKDTGSDVVLEWLYSRGDILSEINSDGWVSVTCPNHSEHTDGDSGGRYHPATRSFCCYHGHCTHLDSQSFLDWVDREGGPSVTHGVRSDILQETMRVITSTLDPEKMFTHTAESITEEIQQKEVCRLERNEWFNRFVYVVVEDGYFDMEYRTILARNSFNAIYRHVPCSSIHGNSRRVEASVYFDENRHKKGSQMVTGLTYAAGESAILSRDGELYGNRWRDARPVVDKALKTDVSRWLEHGATLVPEPAELEHILNVMAFKVQNPKRKINHAVLHTGKEGCGKDTFWAPLIWAVCGPAVRNRGLVDNDNISGAFGYQLESEILILNELREPNAIDRRALANKLKPIIAAPPETISINKKNLHPYDMVNRVFVLAFSNDQVPITLAAQDRRWFCIRSQSPRMSEAAANGMWQWYNRGGFEEIAAWLYQRDVSKFNPMLAPMDTDFKENLIEGGMSMNEAFLVEMIRGREGEFAAGVVGSPFVAICDRIMMQSPQSPKIPQSVLLHSLEEAGWVDCGRLKSTRHDLRKHIFAAPELIASNTKSALRDLVELPRKTRILDIRQGA